MDTEKIKILRNKITVPLDIAIKLLKENNNDPETSIEKFHIKNIEQVSLIAECDFEKAKENYNFCRHHVEKAIKRINSEQIILTTRETPSPRNEIGFILWPKDKNGENYKSAKRNDAFIPTPDFDYVINEFESVYPIENPWNGFMETSFDLCGHNFFSNATCKIIVERIKQNNTTDPKIEKFKNELIEWLNDKLTYADYITVYGNL